MPLQTGYMYYRCIVCFYTVNCIRRFNKIFITPGHHGLIGLSDVHFVENIVGRFRPKKRNAVQKDCINISFVYNVNVYRGTQLKYCINTTFVYHVKVYRCAERLYRYYVCVPLKYNFI